MVASKRENRFGNGANAGLFRWTSKEGNLYIGYSIKFEYSNVHGVVP